jgi:hypothetical protein
VAVPLLHTITLPDGDSPSNSSQYSMTYEHGDADDTGCGTVKRWASGALTGLTVPTGGRYDWSYRFYLFPVESSEAKSTRVGLGVWHRKLTSNGVTSTWTYDTSLPNEYSFCSRPKPSEPILCFWPEVINAVTAPDGVTTKRYFSAFAGGAGDPADNVLGWDPGEYGLNFSRRRNDGSTVQRFISSEIVDTAGAVVRSEYQKYEGLEQGRLKATRTYFHDDPVTPGVFRYLDTENHNYDGYGRYRQTSMGGNFPGANFKTTFIDHKGPGPSGEWVLNTFTEQCTATESAARATAISGCDQLSNPLVSRFQFDRSTGFLNQRRVLSGTTESSTDLLTTYDRSASGTTETVTESHFGGDLCPLGSPGCDPGSVPKYKLVGTYDAGVLESSQYSGFGFAVEDLTIDGNTGLVSSVRDSAGGAEVEYGYDAMGRTRSALPSTSPSTGETRWEFSSGVTPAWATEKRFGVSPDVALSERKWLLDGFGRVRQEVVELPDARSVRSTSYDALGRVETVSELGPSDGPHFFTTNTYDFLGRLRTVTSPDGSVIETRYVGSRLQARRIRRATSDSGAQTDTWTCEEYDRFGRLHEIHEGVGLTVDGLACAAGAISQTSYSYDEADRLVNVSMTADGVTQVRQFTYDRRGFLLSEQHPERSSTVYSGFDARGHATGRRDGSPSGAFDVTMSYDGAERLTTIVEKATGRLLKEFVYAEENVCSPDCDWRRGKLWKSVRHNWQSPTSKVVVTDTFTFKGKDGRASIKTTKVDDGAHVTEFTSSYSHDDLGNTTTIGYPACAGCGAGPVRTVTSDFTSGKGLLSAVSGFTTAAPNGVTYWPNGLMRSIHHSHGVTETQEYNPANGMARPHRFEFTGWTVPVQCASPVLSGPQSSIVGYGESATLTVSASNGGAGTLSYAWFRGTAPDRSNAVGTGTSYATPSLTDNQPYWVSVTNTCGTAAASTDSATVTARVRLATPSDVVATPLQNGNIQVTWTAVPGATSYLILKKSGTGGFGASSGTSPWLDSATAPYVGYVYRVVAQRATAEPSLESEGDAAVPTPWTQPTIAAGTVILGADLGELRRATDALREVSGLPRNWGTYEATPGPIFAWHFAEVHAKLSESRTQLRATYGVPPVHLGAAPSAGQLITGAPMVLLRAGVQ